MQISSLSFFRGAVIGLQSIVAAALVVPTAVTAQEEEDYPGQQQTKGRGRTVEVDANIHF